MSEAAVSAPTPKVLTGLTCASCGGALEVAEGWTNVTCRYCDTPLAVVGERGFTRLMVLDEVDQAAASAAVRQWFRRGIRKDPALRREASFVEAFLAWFPFVRARCDVVGWLLGVNRRRVKRGSRWVTVEDPVERQVERPEDRTMAAAEMAEFGVHRINLVGDRLLPLDEETLRARGMVFRPSCSAAEVADSLIDQAVSESQRRGAPQRVTFSWLAVVRRHVTLVYYPLWIFRYRFRGRTYQALVDAEDGTIAYAKAPGNHLYRALALVSACAGACFLGTSALQHLDWALRSEEGLAALAAVALAVAGMVRWGYLQFRHGGVVEEGSGLARDRRPETLSATVKGMLEKLE